MRIDLNNIGIGLKFDIDELYYSNQDSSIMHIGKIIDTLVVENLDTRLNLLNLALLGFLQLPRNLIIKNCSITPNFMIFDTEYLFDFVDDESYLSIDLIHISGKVYGELNLPTLLGVVETGKLKIGHLDIADLKFKQTVNIDNIDEPAMRFFATDIDKITLPDNGESHLLGETILREYNSQAIIEYR